MIKHLIGWSLILLAACDATDRVAIEIELPVDTLELTVRDTFIDTIPVFDTIPVYLDTLPFYLDTIPVFDTTFVVQRVDTTEHPLEGFLLDYGDQREINLIPVTVTTPTSVWVKISLSGNNQKDEAWQLQANGSPVGEQACPVVPDYPPLGTDWVFVGNLPAGEFFLRAVHAILIECYPPTNNFSSANSVHFRSLRLITTVFEEEGL